jgi:hypothetical protein
MCNEPLCGRSRHGWPEAYELVVCPWCVVHPRLAQPFPDHSTSFASLHAMSIRVSLPHAVSCEQVPGLLHLLGRSSHWRRCLLCRRKKVASKSTWLMEPQSTWLTSFKCSRRLKDPPPPTHTHTPTPMQFAANCPMSLSVARYSTLHRNNLHVFSLHRQKFSWCEHTFNVVVYDCMCLQCHS